jgi:invasion protein IalB
MCCTVSRCFVTIVLACLIITSATAVETNALALTYSPWAKSCVRETCFIGTDGRTNPICVPIVSAALIERNAGAIKTLRVILPARMSLERGVRITIGSGQPIERSYTGCFANGCRADYEAGPELVEQLKQARTLVIEARDKANSLISFAVPLADFTDVYDGPAQATKVVELSTQEMQGELESRRRDEEERTAQCQ